MASEKKVILVIGATGAQGMHAIDALLAPSTDGTPSPYTIRALTRDVKGTRAQALAERGVELIEGSFMDFPSVEAALKGAYGAFVNTDGGTVGDIKETYAGMRIFEMAKAAKSVRHYIWSGTNYTLKLGGYDSQYNVEHSNAKARVTDYMKAQESDTSEGGMSWTVLTFPIYMDMLKLFQLGPMNIRSDGTRVFANPLSAGPVPLVSLKDIGFWVRYTLDNGRSDPKLSGKNVTLASDWVSFPDLPKTFTELTGLPAIYKPLSVTEWFDYIGSGKDEYFSLDGEGTGAQRRTWRDNVTCWWNWWRDSSKFLESQIDMDWIRNVNPSTVGLEEWMKQNEYDGRMDRSVLKMAEDGKGRAGPDLQKTSTL